MPIPHPLHRAALTLDILVFILCCAGIVQISSKAGLGVDLKSENGRVYCTGVDDPSTNTLLRAGDRLSTLAGQPLLRVEEVEFLLDSREVGESVPCSLERDGISVTVPVTLVRYYSVWYAVIVIFVSGLFFFVGVLVSLRRPGDRAAQVFHLGAVGTAVMLSTTWGQYATSPAFVGISLRVIFSTMYAYVPVWFFHFTKLFPRERNETSRGFHHAVLYLFATILAAANGATFIHAAHTGLVTDFRVHLEIFTVTRWFLVLLVCAGLYMIRRAYVGAGDESERRRLRWVVWGLFAGFLPFVVLWVIPSILLSFPLVPEEVMLLAAGAIPIAFGISIVKYHILNIDLILNRSVVYTVVMAILVTLYVGVVAGAAAIVATFTFRVSVLISAMAAILMALAFEPLRRIVQHAVDRRFFRVRYDYRKVGVELLEEIKQAPSTASLARQCTERLGAIIPTDKLGFLVVRGENKRLEVLAQLVSEDGADARFPSGAHDLWLGERIPLALEEHIEPGVPCLPGDRNMFEEWGLALAVPLLAKDARLVGLILLGPKKAGTRFTSEDIDLLTTVGANAGMELERIQLMQQLLLKEEEAERLQLLNTLKSDFVSYVSHDLRTPLTSIKLYAELLAPHIAKGDRKAKGFIAVIEGEAGRLNRMVTTILDSARIEEGAIRYAIKDANMVEIVKTVLDRMEYQLQKEGFTVDVRLPRDKRGLPFRADADAVSEALINLLANAMKYSGVSRTLGVTAGRQKNGVFCSVRDRGTGIRKEVLPHLFEKFYRDPALPQKTQGVGIGLSVVKHIMDAHKGKIEVKSAPGKGSQFVLWFPTPQSRHPGEDHEVHSRRRR